MKLKHRIIYSFDEIIDETASSQNGIAPMKLIIPMINFC
jgi:hypothetical protein